MKQYKTQYGTIFAVKEHNGAPAIMCRAERSETWSLSSMIEPFTPGAWTADELQGQLDSWAATKGWTPFKESPACLCENCTCTGCHEDCFRHCKGCGHPVDHCNSYQTEGEKFRHQDQDKEATPCNTEPTAPTGDAAATTDASAVPMPSTAAETTTTSESGADAGTLKSPLSGDTGRNSLPAPASPASAGAATQSLSAAGPASLAAKDMNVPTFDYSGLDDPTRDTLRWAEREIGDARRDYIARIAQAVSIAHDALCFGVVQNLDNSKHGNRGENAFANWCESVGIKRSTAYNLLQVQALLSGSTPEEQAVLEAASPSLLYAAAKPSAPAELVQAVKDGDITTHKQYQDLLARYNAEKSARQQAEQERDEAATHIQAARDMQIDTARERDDALKQRDDANRRANEAENFAADVQKLANRRHDENAELKAHIRELETRPVEVAVAQPGEDQIEAWRKEGEARAAAALRESIRKADQAMADAQRQVNALQDQLAAAVPDADACQRTADTLYETTENLRLLLRTQLRQAQLPPADYGSVVAHVLQAADALRDTVRSCAPAGYTMDEEDDFL